MVFGLLVFAFICGLGVLAALVPIGHGFVPKGGGWFTPAAAGGAFTSHPLLIAVPSAALFVLGLLDWRRPWRVEHLDLLALAGFFPVAMLLSDDLSPAGLWLAAVCLGWLCARMLGESFGTWRMPQLRPSISSRWLGLAILILLLIRIGSIPAGNILDVGQASSLGAWRLLHGLHLYGAESWPGPGGLRIYRPDSYGPFAYYAYIPFAVIFPPAPAALATLLPAVCFDALTLAGLHKLGQRLGGRSLAPWPPRSSSARSYSWATGSTATSPGSTRSSSSRSSRPGRTTKQPTPQRTEPQAPAATNPAFPRRWLRAVRPIPPPARRHNPPTHSRGRPPHSRGRTPTTEAEPPQPIACLTVPDATPSPGPTPRCAEMRVPASLPHSTC